MTLAAAVLALAAGSALPTPAAEDFLGIPGELIGQHGPTADVLHGLELVGRSDLALPAGGPAPAGLPLGNHGGIALVDDCAYVGRWHDYRGKDEVTIVDVSDPATPHAIGEVPGSALTGAVTREIRAIDLGDTELLVALVFSQAAGGRTNSLLFYRFADGDCTRPELAGSFDMRAFRGHEFFLWVDPSPVVPRGSPRVLAVVTAPIAPPNVEVIDATDPKTPVLVGAYDAGLPVVSPDEAAGTYLGSYAHSISLSGDGSEAYVSYWDGGFFTLDATALTTAGGAFAPKGAMSVPLRHSEGELGNVHSAVRAANGSIVVGHELYETTDGCPYGWMKVVDPGSVSKPPSVLGEFRLDANDPLGCVPMPGAPPPLVEGMPAPRTVDARNSLGELIDGTFTMHNQTLVGNYALASWYGAGLRVVDVADPSAPREVAMFVPAPNERTPFVGTIPDTPAPVYGAFGTSANDWWVAMWSYPVVRDGLIYVADVRNGLYVLRATPGTPLADALAATSFAEGNSNLGSLS